jgi:hypothetical protein
MKKMKKEVECGNGHKWGVSWNTYGAVPCPFPECGSLCDVNHPIDAEFEEVSDRLLVEKVADEVGDEEDRRE